MFQDAVSKKMMTTWMDYRSYELEMQYQDGRIQMSDYQLVKVDDSFATEADINSMVDSFQMTIDDKVLEKYEVSFADVLAQTDAYVGELLDTIDELGLKDNTIFIFTSDNGPHKEGGADPAYFNSNAQFKGLKRDLYEGGILLQSFSQKLNLDKYVEDKLGLE